MLVPMASLRIGFNGLWYVFIPLRIGTTSNFVQDRVKDARIGIDARMISHEKATLINSKISASNSKLIYPPQNLVDLIWKDKPPKPKAPIFIQPIEFTGSLWSLLIPNFCLIPWSVGMDAHAKLRKLRDWISSQPPSVPSYSQHPATPAQMQVGTLITSLSSIGKAYHNP